MTAPARFETRRDGYERWRTWEDGRDRYVYVHRLAAVAWGIIDGLDDSPYAHHIDSIKRLNVEADLEARPPDRDGDFHLNGGALS